MVGSILTLQHAGLRQRTWRANASRAPMFRRIRRHIRGIFGQIS